MDFTNAANTYKNQQIMTSPPEKLTLMLYNGAIRFVKEAILAIDQGNIEKSHNANMRAQAIIREFMATLDMKYELSKDYQKMYVYLKRRLVQANIHKDKNQLEEVQKILTDLRDAWSQAMSTVSKNKAGNR